LNLNTYARWWLPLCLRLIICIFVFIDYFVDFESLWLDLMYKLLKVMRIGSDCHGVLDMPTTTKVFIGPWILTKLQQPLGIHFVVCCVETLQVKTQSLQTLNTKVFLVFKSFNVFLSIQLWQFNICPFQVHYILIVLHLKLVIFKLHYVLGIKNQLLELGTHHLCSQCPLLKSQCSFITHGSIHM
jgi:hypothetical protein